MAKILLEFEDVLIDIMRVSLIERKTEWSEDAETYVHKIIMNRALPDMSLIRDKEFEYNDKDYRDTKYKELKKKMQEIEYIVIL